MRFYWRGGAGLFTLGLDQSASTGVHWRKPAAFASFLLPWWSFGVRASATQFGRRCSVQSVTP